MIAVLAGVVSPLVLRNVGDARVAATKAQIEMLGLALDAYRLDNDYYPSTAQGLMALVSEPAGAPLPRFWRGPYLKRGVPVDGWGRPFSYLSPGTSNPVGYELVSYGRDGQPGGTDEDADLHSWEATPR